MERLMLQVFSKGDVIVGAASVPISSLTRTRSQWISLFDSAQAKTGEVLLILRANDSGAQSPTFSAISERSKSSALERANSQSPTGRSSSDAFQRQQLHGLKHKLGRLSQQSPDASSAADVNHPSHAPASAAEQQSSNGLQQSEAASSPAEAQVPQDHAASSGADIVSRAVDATKPDSSNESERIQDLLDTTAQQRDANSTKSAPHSSTTQQQDPSSHSGSEGPQAKATQQAIKAFKHSQGQAASRCSIAAGTAWSWDLSHSGLFRWSQWPALPCSPGRGCHLHYRPVQSATHAGVHGRGRCQAGIGMATLVWVIGYWLRKHDQNAQWLSCKWAETLLAVPATGCSEVL